MLLRQRLRAERLAFAVDAPAIVPPKRFLALLRPGMTVASYVALPGEADPSALAHAALERGCRLALPHVTNRAAPMRFLDWAPGEPLARGPLGLSQPDADAPEVTPDLVLTPLLGFDARLNRLGQGAGFYDRAFAHISPALGIGPGLRIGPVLRIGVAWSMQRCDTLPVDAWDVPMDGIVTERGWFDPETDR